MSVERAAWKGLAAGSASRFELWSRVLRARGVKAMAEIGVWKGEFAKQILERCPFIERYYMIDPWARLPDWNKPLNVDRSTFDEVYAEAMGKTSFASEKVVVLRGRTQDVIERIPDGALDFAYVDGDHTLRGITIDLIRLFPKVKSGGLIGGDDFTDDPWQHGERFDPTFVRPFSVYFAEAMNLPIAALPFQQFVIHKGADSSFAFVDAEGNRGRVSLNLRPPGSDAR